jgi:hypothetical protein
MGMSARKYGVVLCALGFTLLLYACGDLGMVLPSQGSYRVSARVTTPKDNFSRNARSVADSGKDNYTLDAYSFVNKFSEIYPYFVNSVANDPDIRGLTVFVQDYSGNRVSRRVQYQLNLDEQEARKSADEPKSPADEPKSATETPWETPDGAETPAQENPNEAAGKVSPGDLPEDEAPMLDAAETADTPAKPETAPAETAGAPAETGTGTAVSSAEAEAASVETGTGTAVSSAEAETASAGTGTAVSSVEAETAPAETGIGNAVSSAEAETASAGTGTVVSSAETETASVETETGTAVSSTEAKTGTGDSGAAGDTGTDALSPGTTVPEAPLVVPPPREISKPPIPDDEIVKVKQLAQDLPAFRIIEDLEIGRYNLVFQVIGKGTEVILYRTFKPIYFLGDAKFTLEDIHSFLPMAVTRGKLIPMGINVMLTTEIKADKPLDPYVIWYSGKKILAQGRVSGGADQLFWKTPEKTGFHNVRAEVFPLLPGDRVTENMMGKIKELSLPVSSNSDGIQQFNGYEPSDGFIGWYQFWGALDDAKAPNNAQRSLASLYAQPPRWIPFNGMYGLFVGRDDVYTLPGTPFKLAQNDQGTGRMYFHLAALSEGSILSIRFAAQEKPPRAAAAQKDAEETADGTATLDLFLAGDALILRIASEDASREEALDLNDGEFIGEFITVVVEFVIAPDRFDAELRLGNPSENPAETTGLLSVALAKPISGEGAILLGGGEKSAGYEKSVKLPVFDETATFGGGTMALNELAFSYARQSVPEDEEEFDFGMSVWSEEEEPGAEQESSSLRAL